MLVAAKYDEVLIQPDVEETVSGFPGERAEGIERLHGRCQSAVDGTANRPLRVDRGGRAASGVMMLFLMFVLESRNFVPVIGGRSWRITQTGSSSQARASFSSGPTALLPEHQLRITNKIRSPNGGLA